MVISDQDKNKFLGRLAASEVLSLLQDYESSLPTSLRIEELLEIVISALFAFHKGIEYNNRQGPKNNAGIKFLDNAPYTDPLGNSLSVKVTFPKLEIPEQLIEYVQETLTNFLDLQTAFAMGDKDKVPIPKLELETQVQFWSEEARRQAHLVREARESITSHAKRITHLRQEIKVMEQRLKIISKRSKNHGKAFSKPSRMNSQDSVRKTDIREILKILERLGVFPADYHPHKGGKYHD
jgi:hypothetical protein